MRPQRCTHFVATSNKDAPLPTVAYINTRCLPQLTCALLLSQHINIRFDELYFGNVTNSKLKLFTDILNINFNNYIFYNNIYLWFVYWFGCKKCVYSPGRREGVSDLLNYNRTTSPPIKMCNRGFFTEYELGAGNCSSWPCPIGIWQLGDIPRGRGTHYHVMSINVGVTNVLSPNLTSEMPTLLILICEIISVLTVLKVSFITLL